MSANTELVEKVTIKNKDVIKDIKKWNVIFYNDDFTSVDFVIGVLMEIFNYDESSATDLTYKIHDEGSAIVGTYIYEIAEQKCADTLYVAYAEGFPLQVKMKQA